MLSNEKCMKKMKPTLAMLPLLTSFSSLHFGLLKKLYRKEKESICTVKNSYNTENREQTGKYQRRVGWGMREIGDGDEGGHL